MGYWQEKLVRAAPVELATDRPRRTEPQRTGPRRTGPQHTGPQHTGPRRTGPQRNDWLEEKAPLPAGAGALLAPASGDDRHLVLLTAWAAVLHRHTAATDLLIGFQAPATGALPLPIRLQLDPAASFTESVDSARRTVTEAVRQVGALPPADPGWGELIRVAVAEEAGFPGVELVVGFSAEGLRLRFDGSLYHRGTAAWLLSHCATLLAAAAREPDRSVGRLPVQETPVPPAWPVSVPPGGVPPGAPGDRESLVDRFRTVVTRHADRLAVSGPSRAYRYAELDRITNRLSHMLRRVADPGGRLALLCEHDTGVAVGVWSALKAGMTYVPLDPRQPDERLGRLVAEADVAAVACDPGLARRAAQLAQGRPLVRLEPAGPDASGPAIPPVDPDTPAYLLHTSGSTGRPKAVVQSHRNVLAHALTYAQRVGIGAGDRVPLLGRFTFDGGMMDLFGATLSGASLHVIDPLSPAPELRRRIAEAGASHLHCTPTLFRHLVSDLSEVNPSFVPIRTVVLGGEAATGEDLRRFFAAFPADSVLVNGLGPTECTLALQHLATRADADFAALPIGHPVTGVEVRLLDETGQVTEVFGELELRGDRLAHGYFRQPNATATAFGSYPDGTRCYRTGDLARRRPDGALVFQGRKDRQVKIRGHRVEPGEVEAALLAHPTVAQAAVVLAELRDRPALVGYVTAATAVPPDPAELTSYLGRVLADYAVPARIVPLANLPLGPTGKRDHSRLPPPPDLPTAEPDQPSTPAEQAVARIWRRVLGIPTASLHTSFLASGGDSVRLLELISAVRAEFGADVPLPDFLRTPTLATLAGYVAETPNHRRGA